MVDYILFFLYINKARRGVEQLAARRAHNPEAAGSSPAPAKHVSPCVTRIYNTTKPNKVGLSVEITSNLNYGFKPRFLLQSEVLWLSPI